MAGVARRWLAGRAGLLGVLATWDGGRQLQPQVPGHPISMFDLGVKLGLANCHSYR